MKFTRQSTEQRNVIRGYDADSISLGEQTLETSCLFSAEQLLEEWSPKSPGDLTADHFIPALAWEPEIILLGTGVRQIFPPLEVIAAIRARGIGFEVMDTGAVCRTFNVLIGEDRRVVAAILFDR